MRHAIEYTKAIRREIMGAYQDCRIDARTCCKLYTEITDTIELAAVGHLTFVELVLVARNYKTALRKAIKSHVR